MTQTILITGATDGIGLATAKMLVAAGHQVLIHGRSMNKLNHTAQQLEPLSSTARVSSYCADLSQLKAVDELVQTITSEHQQLDVLINNAGVLKTANTRTDDGLDVRFAVNTIAPYVLTKGLMPLFKPSSRVINLSSAAQATVNLAALAGTQVVTEDFAAYAQSKLALTMWSMHLAESTKVHGPVITAINPGSMLGSKMVQEGFGVAGGDLQVGANILKQAALSDTFADANGRYFDNDIGQFGTPHADALDATKNQAVVEVIETICQQPRS